MAFLNTGSKNDIDSLTGEECEENARNLDSIESLDDVYKTYIPIPPTVTWFESSSTSTLKDAASNGESIECNDLQESLARTYLQDKENNYKNIKAIPPRPPPRPHRPLHLQVTDKLNEKHFKQQLHKDKDPPIRIASGEVEKKPEISDVNQSNNSMDINHCTCNASPTQAGNGMQYMQPSNGRHEMIASDYYAQQMAMQMANPMASYGGYGLSQFMVMTPEDHFNYAQLQDHLQNVHSFGHYQGLAGVQGMQGLQGLQGLQGMSALSGMQGNFRMPGLEYGQFSHYPNMEGGGLGIRAKSAIDESIGMQGSKGNFLIPGYSQYPNMEGGGISTKGNSTTEESSENAPDFCECSSDENSNSGRTEASSDNIRNTDDSPPASVKSKHDMGKSCNCFQRQKRDNATADPDACNCCMGCSYNQANQANQASQTCNRPGPAAPGYCAEPATRAPSTQAPQLPTPCGDMGGSFDLPECVGMSPQCRVGRPCCGPLTSRFNFLDMNPCRNMCCGSSVPDCEPMAPPTCCPPPPNCCGSSPPPTCRPTAPLLCPPPPPCCPPPPPCCPPPPPCCPPPPPCCPPPPPCCLPPPPPPPPPCCPQPAQPVCCPMPCPPPFCCSPTPENCACSGNCLDIDGFLQKLRATQQQQMCMAALANNCCNDRFQARTVYMADYQPYCGQGNCFNHFPNCCDCCPSPCRPPGGGVGGAGSAGGGGGGAGCGVGGMPQCCPGPGPCPCPCSMPISGCGCEPSYIIPCPCPAPYPATCCHPCYAPCAVPFLSDCLPPPPPPCGPCCPSTCSATCPPPCPNSGSNACCSGCPMSCELPPEPCCVQASQATSCNLTQCDSFS